MKLFLEVFQSLPIQHIPVFTYWSATDTHTVTLIGDEVKDIGHVFYFVLKASIANINLCLCIFLKKCSLQ